MINNISDIIDAVELGEHSFFTLKDVEIERCVDGSVFCIAGGESVILKAVIDNEIYALKCYTSQRVGLKKRYDILAEVSKQDKTVLGVTYLEKELVIIDNYGAQKAIDVLMYRWIDGVTLLDAMEKCVGFYDGKGLLGLCGRTVNLARRVLTLPITHGDIKPQNIIVCDSGDLVLIDYDMLFTDDLPCDDVVRTHWYQHPMSEQWDEDYAFAVIIISLFLLSLEPLLFHRYHNGENIIIDANKITNFGSLNREIIDLIAPYPNYMALFEIVSSSHPPMRGISELLANIPGGKPLHRKPIDESGDIRRVICDNGFYGFVDGTDNLIIGCCYSDATPFNDGIAGVRLNGLWYLFDDTGRVANKEIYDDVGVSNGGVVPVCKNGKWYYISSYTFNPICDDRYDYAYPFSCGAGLVRCDNSFYFVDMCGAHLFGALEFNYARPFVNGYSIVANDKYFVIDIYGRQVTEAISERILSYDGKSLYYRSQEGEVGVKVCGI